jgi:hypothetical protein
VGSYKPSELNSLPRTSNHVRRALVAARDIADAQESDPVRSRHILYGALSISNCHIIQALLARGISKGDINLYRLPDGSETPPRPVISGYTSDDTEGPDLLGIKKEVEALCSVLAAKDVKRKCQNSGDDVVSEFFLPTYIIKRWENLLDFSKNGPILRSFPHFS